MSSVNGKKKKNVFFAIETHDQALLAIKRSSIALFVIAAIQLVIGFTFYPTFPGELLVGTCFCVTFGFALMVLKSRIVAVVLLLLTSAIVISHFLRAINLVDFFSPINAINMVEFLSPIVILLLVISGKAVEATFKLHR